MNTDDLVNLTPHTVRLLDVNGITFGRWNSAGEARATTTREVVDSVTVGGVIEQEPLKGQVWSESFSVYRITFGPVEGLPDPVAGRRYIVSRVAAEAARAQGRATDDLLIPDDLVRGPDGQPVGCRGFARL